MTGYAGDLIPAVLSEKGEGCVVNSGFLPVFVQLIYQRNQGVLRDDVPSGVEICVGNSLIGITGRGQLLPQELPGGLIVFLIQPEGQPRPAVKAEGNTFLPLQRLLLRCDSLAVLFQQIAVVPAVQNAETGGRDFLPRYGPMGHAVMGALVSDTALCIQGFSVAGRTDYGVFPHIVIQRADQQPLPALFAE